MSTIHVIKRTGEKEPYDLDKIHKMVLVACDGINNVSASQVEIQSGLQLYDGIHTHEIQEILIKSAANLITLDTPNYQYVAARLILFGLYKDVWGGPEPITLADMINRNIEEGVYDPVILEKYSTKEIERLNSYINHDRDLKFAYAGIRQVYDKYLLQDRSTGAIFETPQFMYMMIAATLFADYPEETRMSYVKKYYDACSLHKLNLPTPIMGGVRTPMRQFSSCVLIDVGDSLDSIFSSDHAAGIYTAQRAGIGLNIGRIRGIGSKIRGGEVRHTGMLPFIHKFSTTINCCTQNGIRGGSASLHVPIWHQEIKDIIVLKNNKGTEGENRARKMDYSIQFSKLFYERYLKNEEITLFSPHDVPGLYELFGVDNDKFDELYTKYERAYSVPKTKVPARELIEAIMTERAETGRIYIMNMDHANTHSPFVSQVTMSNLCQEVILPTSPISNVHENDGEIATCILSAINLAAIKDYGDFEVLCDLVVRSLDAIVDYQEYPVKSAEISSKARRNIGCGVINYAYYLAKRDMHFDDVESAQEMAKVAESLQYFMLKASNQLAKEHGACEKFSETKYGQGILPIDTYKRDIDEFLGTDLLWDWESLRKDIKEHGLRNSTLTCQMPSESSSVVSASTNGIDPVRSLLTVKVSKKGTLILPVPEYTTLKNKYDILWELKDNSGFLRNVAAMQKFMDQSISTNTSYVPDNYEGNKVPMSLMIKDMLLAYKYGLKTMYYHHTYDGKTEEDTALVEGNATNAECESCTI